MTRRGWSRGSDAAVAALSLAHNDPAGRRGTLVERKILGRYIVMDPRICHGKPTFRGTRIFVASVLEQAARGMDWESIEESWGGSVTHEAIAEAVDLARQAFLKHADEFTIESVPV